MTHPTLSRRRFMQSAAAVSAGFVGLSRLSEAAAEAGSLAAAADAAPGFGYGPLVADPQRVLDLPAGFSYRVIAQLGQEMDDGLFVPGKHDGSAAFPVPCGKPEETILIVNHEVDPRRYRLGPFGWSLERLGRVDPAKIYDLGHGENPGLGGTTTHVYNTRTGHVTRRYMSLLGTERNCAGGPTPWNSWISCEETVTRAGDAAEKDHGYNFEVPASVEVAPADPVPLTDMGRMNHEAVAVDPATGIIYQTEDRQDGAFYRFIPHVPGQLQKGGRLQALVVRDQPSLDTRNWLRPIGEEEAAAYAAMGSHAAMDASDFSPSETPLHTPMDVNWIDVEDVTAPRDDLRHQVFANGGAKFARGEGMWWGRQSVFFACTTGGLNRKGQLWRYVPSRIEGQPDEARFPGRLELYLEPNDHELVENCDNLTVAPWGDLVLCEDSKNKNDLVGVTPEGGLYKLGRNALSGSEFAGSCFSPDGTTLFTNIQADGITVAITGPWHG
ncbi:MAG: alkaline phosphatase PhoX [Planctomycetota bacterium]